MPASITAIRVRPCPHSLLTVEEDYVDIVLALALCHQARKLDKESGRRARVVRADKLHHRDALCIVVTGYDQRFSGCSGKFKDDVGHGNRSIRSLARERI